MIDCLIESENLTRCDIRYGIIPKIIEPLENRIKIKQ